MTIQDICVEEAAWPFCIGHLQRVLEIEMFPRPCPVVALVNTTPLLFVCTVFVFHGQGSQALAHKGEKVRKEKERETFSYLFKDNLFLICLNTTFVRSW